MYILSIYDCHMRSRLSGTEYSSCFNKKGWPRRQLNWHWAPPPHQTRWSSRRVTRSLASGDSRGERQGFGRWWRILGSGQARILLVSRLSRGRLRSSGRIGCGASCSPTRCGPLTLALPRWTLHLKRKLDSIRCYSQNERWSGCMEKGLPITDDGLFGEEEESSSSNPEEGDHLFSFFSRRRAFANQVETCVRVMPKMMN